MPAPRFIVGEISKSWVDGQPTTHTGLISQQFEAMIETQLQRGYRLHSFQLSTAYAEATDQLNETIVAVFERLSS